MRYLSICLLYLLFLDTITIAQLDSTSKITEEVLEDILVEPAEESDAEELVEIFEELIRNPIDINSADLLSYQNFQKWINNQQILF